MSQLSPRLDPVASTALAADDVARARPRRRWFASFVVLLLAAVVLGLALVAWQQPPDGNERGDTLLRFAGRLHPMGVHVPIGLLLLVPLLEVCGIPRRFRHLQASAGFVLWLGTITAVGAAAFGYVLARFDGVAGETLGWHMWSGVITAGLAVVTVMLRLASVPAMPRGVIVPVSASATTAVVVPPISRRRVGATLLYAIALVALVAMVSITGHFGGQMTYGATYLSEYAPPEIARFLGPVKADGPSPRATTQTVNRADELGEAPLPPAAATQPEAPATLPAPVPLIPESPTTSSTLVEPLATTEPTIPAAAATPAEATIVAEPTPTPTTSPATVPAELTAAEAPPATAGAAFAGPITFEGHLAPMFAQSCVSCHGPTKVKGGLRLDSLAGLQQGGESGPSVVAGNAEASDLYHRMTLPIDDDEAMPPANARRRPTVAQIDAVRRWIAAGAKD